MFDGSFEAFYDLDRQNQIEELGGVVGTGRGPGLGDEAARFGAPANFDATLAQGRSGPRQERGSNVGVYQQALCGVADARPLAFRVDQDRQRHVKVGGTIDVDVTVSLVVLEHRHPRFLGDPADKALAATWDDEVNPAIERQQMAY